MNDKGKSRKDNKLTITATATLLTCVIVCVLLYILRIYWSSDLRRTAKSMTKDGTVQLTAVYPPALSLEDNGDIYIMVKNLTTSPLTVTVVTDYDPCSVRLSEGNIIEFSDLQPGEIQTEQVQVYTLGGRIGDTEVVTEVVRETFGLTFTVNSAYTSTLSLPLQIKHTTVVGARLPGFRHLLMSVDRGIVTAVVSAVQAVVTSIVTLLASLPIRREALSKHLEGLMRFMRDLMRSVSSLPVSESIERYTRSTEIG